MKNKILFIISAMFVLVLTGCPQPQGSLKKNATAASWPENPDILRIVVSIPPQKVFVNKISGNNAHVISLLEEGQDFLTAKPSPERLALLKDAKLFFAIGAPFEKSLQLPEAIKKVDIRKGLKIKPFASHTRYLNGSKSFRADPYFWMSTEMVVSSSSEVYMTLRESLPNVSPDALQQNFTRFVSQLNRLEGDIKHMLMSAGGKEFYTDYPVLGYFATQFGLKQVYFSREEGKGINDLARNAIKDDVHIIFFGPYLPDNITVKLEELIKGKVASVDPMRADYFKNMTEIAKDIQTGVNKK